MTIDRHDQALYAKLMAQAKPKDITKERDSRFVQAYYHLNLQARWGRLDPDKEAEYLARG